MRFVFCSLIDSIERDITPDDSFVMLATDGLFDVFKHEECTMSTIHWINSPERDPDAICHALVGCGELTERKKERKKERLFIKHSFIIISFSL